VLAAFIIIALMVEAVTPSETSVNFYQTTRRNIPEDSHLHIRRRENLKSHQYTYLRLGSSNQIGLPPGSKQHNADR
jgi:hypothetical protein